MAQIGRLRNIGLGRETTKGTAVSPSYWISVESGKVIPLVEYAADMGTFGRIEAPVQSKIVKSDAITTFTAPVRSDWIGAVLRAALGTSSSTLAGGETAVWEHTFTVKNDNDHPSYTLVVKDGITTESSLYSQLNKLTLSCEAGGLLMAEGEFIGKSLASDTETVSYSTDHIWKGSQGTIKLATAISGLSGASAVAFHRFSLTIEKNLLPHHTFGSVTLAENINQAFKVSGELSILHANNTYRDFVTAGSERAVQILFAGDAIGNAETTELRIQLAKAAFEEWDLDEGNDDAQMETITFNAQYDPDEGTPQMMNVLLTNEENTSAY